MTGTQVHPIIDCVSPTSVHTAVWAVRGLQGVHTSPGAIIYVLPTYFSLTFRALLYQMV